MPAVRSNNRCWVRRRGWRTESEAVVEAIREEKVEVGQASAQGDAKVRRYLSAEAVAERKRRSREQLEKNGGHQLRDVRLDREAKEAFQALQVKHPGLDGGAIVRLALVATARKKG